MDSISKLIEQRIGYTNLLDDLTENLSWSELNTLLLELFRKKTKAITPARLLNQFQRNRFTMPSSADAIAIKELELKCLKLASDKGFRPITLSPLTSMGTCSAVGFVDQNNVISALRGTEVVSDATNVFALLIANEFKKQKNTAFIKYAAAHRHVRAQALSNPAFTAHFSVFCMATGGMDKGNFSFELEQILEHITTHLSIFSNEFHKEKFILKIFLKEENETFSLKLKEALKKITNKLTIEIEKQSNPGDYYKLVQFKFFLVRDRNDINLSDGGFIDWTQKLIPNKKHRLIISGIGTELIQKIKQKQLP